MNESYAIGCDVGVTHVKLVAVSPASGEVLSRRQVDTLADRADWPDRVRDAIAAAEQAHGRAAHVGLAAPGIAAPDGRCIAWMRGRLAEVEGLDWSQRLGRPVPVLNDAQAALLGEVWQGAARGASNVLLLTLGTGVGGAVMVDGRLLKGHLGRAGHVGHISLDPKGPRDIVNTPGSLEDKVGNVTIATRTNGRFRSTHELVEAFRTGDADARAMWHETVDALAAGVASLVNVVDPEVVVLGGGIAAAGDALFEPLANAMDRCEWRPHGSRVRVLPAALGEYAGAIGAAWNAIRQGQQ
jgi:glucokinase